MDRLLEIQDDIRAMRSLKSADQSAFTSILEKIDRLYEDLVAEVQSIQDGTQEAFWESRCQVLIETLRNLADLAKNNSAKVESENEKLRREVSDLQKKVSDLERKVEKLQEDKQNLVAGQIAFEVDKAVLKKVLEGIQVPDAKELSIGAMEKAINGERNYTDIFTEKQREHAERQWNELKSQLGWRGKHYRRLKELKSLRHEIAHPDFHVRQMSEADVAKLSLQPEMKAICKEFLAMLRKLR